MEQKVRDHPCPEEPLELPHCRRLVIILRLLIEAGDRDAIGIRDCTDP